MRNMTVTVVLLAAVGWPGWVGLGVSACGSPPEAEREYYDRGVYSGGRVQPQAKPKFWQPSYRGSIPQSSSRAERNLLAPVGPWVIYDQTDQECGGYVWVDSYKSSMSFLRNDLGSIGADYWPSDCTEPTCAFIATGNNHLYWLDQLKGNGAQINGVDLKYWTETTGPNIIRVTFRSNASIPGLGNPHGPHDYYQMSVPGYIGGPGGFTAYGIRMSTPSDAEIATGLVAGYMVDELIDPGLPIGWNGNNLVGNAVETPMIDWHQTVSPYGRSFGVGMSLDEGWCDFDPDWPTMGWYLAADDHIDPDPTFDIFTWMDKDRQQLCDCIGTAGCIGAYWYGTPSCADDSIPGEERAPVGSIYMLLWDGSYHCHEGNDMVWWSDFYKDWIGPIDTGIQGVKQACLTTLGRIAPHLGCYGEPDVYSSFLDVDLFRVKLASRGSVTIGGQQYLRSPRLRVDIDTVQPVDLYLRLWDSTFTELANSSSDGMYAATDPPREPGDPYYGEDLLMPSLDPLLIFDDHFVDPTDNVNIIEDSYFIGVSWEGNKDYDPQMAASGTDGDPVTQGDQVGNYFLRIAVGHLTRKAGAGTVVSEIDDSIEFASSLTDLGGGVYTSGEPPEANMADLGGNHMFRGHDLGSVDPNLAPSCVGDVDIYEVPPGDANFATGNGVLARVESNIHGSGNMACAIYKWDGVNAPELVAVGDDMASETTPTDPIAYTVIDDDTVGYFVAVTGVGDWNSSATGEFWYAANNFVDTLPADLEIPGTDDMNTGGQGFYELKVTLTGPHTDVPNPAAPTQPWEPNDSLAQADANGLLPNQRDGGLAMNGIPAGQVLAQYSSADDPYIGGEPEGTGIYLGDGVHGENDTIDQGGDVDIYAFGANAGEIIQIGVDAGSTLDPVDPDRGLVSRCYLFDQDGSLLASPQNYVGDYDTTGGCAGYRNMSSRLHYRAPRTGMYYAVIVGADLRKSADGSQLPYDLDIDGTVLGGMVELGVNVKSEPGINVGFPD